MCQSGKIIWMVVVLIGGSLLMAAGEEKEAVSAAALVFAAEHEGGCLYRAGEVRVLELQGNYRQMGRQYGHLLGAEMVSLYQAAIEDYYIQEMGLSPERIDDVAQAVFFRYPRRYREILLGMAESSGLSEQHVIRLNALEWIPKIYALSYGHCSGVAAWGPYTSGRPLVFGRNNDDGEYFKQFAVPLVIAVFKPADGSIPVALVNYVGVIYAATGMNAEGLFAELNAGPWVGFSLERKSIFTSLFTFLQDCANLDELTLAMLATLPELNTIINAADRRSACSFESSLWHARRRGPNEPGFIAATNHFLSMDWPPANYDPQLRPDTTFRRYENLLRLGQRYYGRFSPAMMMRVLDTTIENGGPTDATDTIFQVVAVPAQLVLWVKMPGTQDWTKVPLGPLMGKE